MMHNKLILQSLELSLHGLQVGLRCGLCSLGIIFAFLQHKPFQYVRACARLVSLNVCALVRMRVLARISMHTYDANICAYK